MSGYPLTTLRDRKLALLLELEIVPAMASNIHHVVVGVAWTPCLIDDFCSRSLCRQPALFSTVEVTPWFLANPHIDR